MFDQVAEKKSGPNWIMLGGLAAFVGLLMAGYVMIN